MKLIKECLETLIKGCKTDIQILKTLDKSKVKYTNDTDESNYFNLHLSNGMRIYKTLRKEYVVQNPMQKVKLEYSGIPTFFATNSVF